MPTSLCLLLLIVSGCSEESELASKTEDELMTVFKEAQAQCSSHPTFEEQTACLTEVRQTPEAIELQKRFKEAGGYRSLPVGRSTNVLDW